MVERGPEKAGVGGSSPSLATIFSTTYRQPANLPFSAWYKFGTRRAENHRSAYFLVRQLPHLPSRVTGTGDMVFTQLGVALLYGSLKSNTCRARSIAVREDLRLNIRETLRFFDEAPKDSRKHASAIVGVCGEDLGIGLLQKYLKDVGGCSSRVVYEKGQPKTPASGTGSGDRLDRWLLVESGSPGHPKRTVYQVEIKNWSAHAIDGKPLPINADGATLKSHRRERWLKCWDPEAKGFRDRNMGKVLTKMQPPVKMDSPDGVARTIEPAIRQDEVQPLICFWWALHPEGEDSSLFRLPLPDGGLNGFDSCWVFSMSTYLRSISESEITLNMPSTARRLDWFQRLFTKDSGPSRF